MKKIIAFIMAAVLLLCMVSCGEAGETPTDATTANPVETQPEPEETTDKIVETDPEPEETTEKIIETDPEPEETTDKVIETEPETGNNDENSNDLEIDFKN